MRNKIRVFLFILLSNFFSAIKSEGGTVQNTFKVSAEVVNGCRFVDTEGSLNVNFPEVTAGMLTNMTTISLKLDCTPGVNPTISINNGAHPDQNGRRQLVSEENPDSKISYFIYDIRNSKKVEWPKNNIFNYNEIGNINIEFDAEIPDTSRLVVGEYSDQLVMTVSW